MTANHSEELSPIKQALLELRELRAQLDDIKNRQHEPIAILGAGLRFPGGAYDLDSFWQLLKNGVDTISQVPPERWDIEAFYDSDPETPGKMSTQYGGFIKNIDQFDAAFFSISPREAISLDPQQRLLLQVTWEALENAGIPADHIFGSPTGVFVGINNSDYFRLLIADHEKIDTYATTGTALSVASGRISYFLGTNGPNISVNTACSSSLVSVHLAVESLRRGECSLALAGGVNLLITPELTINFSKANMMAPDGQCKTFDARADGYVRSDGCGMIILKRLSEAITDGDPILAVIRGSAVNHDGRSGGLTAPNGPSQEAVIAKALENAGLEPTDIGYIETHGTGTSLGDPIEIGALINALCKKRPTDKQLYLGSVKTNIGHTEAAAGIAGLLKAVLTLQNDQIPPNLHFKTLNPHITAVQAAIQIPTDLTPWPGENHHAGVSSFGLSGTNAHMILEKAPQVDIPTNADVRPSHILTLSAQSQTALTELTERYEKYLTNSKNDSLADITFTANTGRTHLNHRLAITASNIEDLLQKLSVFKTGKTPNGVWQGKAFEADPKIAFLFTGYGTHYQSMGRQLYETQPTFRRVIDTCNDLLLTTLPHPLVSVMYPDLESNSKDNHPSQKENLPDLNKMTYGQPAMFALQVALATLWKSWGIEPMAVAGHSVGEYAAAHIAGVLSLEDALKFVAQRGDLMQDLPEDGEMATVFAEEARVTPIIAPFTSQVSIAAINSPETVVISGHREAISEVVQALKAEKIRVRSLNINRAAHSPMVDSMIPGIVEAIKEMKLSLPEVEFFSTVTGNAISSEITQTAYWQRHLRQTVRFADAAMSLYNAGYRIFLEIGPNPTLLSLGQRSVPESEPTTWLPSLREGWQDWEQMLESLGQLYIQGASVDWVSFEKNYGHQRKLSLPTYPWQQKSYWWSDAPKTQLATTPTPVWESVLSAGHKQSEQTPIDLQISTFPAKWEALNHLATSYIANTLHNLGAFTKPDERHTPQSLIEKCSIQPIYLALMSRWLKLLAETAMLQSDGEGFTNPKPLQPQPITEALTTAKKMLADSPFVIEYMRDCGERLAEIITGKESPLETLFPGGSMKRAEALYQDWAHARYFGHIVAAVVEAATCAKPTKALHLLEIGAGTGATTHAVLPILQAERVVYHFTDVSDLFLDRARQKFGAYPFVQYGLLDIEKDGSKQGYGRGQFDIVLAANVIHATQHLDKTLRNVKSLLASDGLLVLFEATSHQPWYDTTTSLIEGWQSFDDEIRQDSPLLSTAQWKAILQEAGFTNIAIFPEDGSAAEVLGEHVIVARAPLSNETPQPTNIEAEDIAHESTQVDATQKTAPTDDLLIRLQTALPDERKDLLLDFVRDHVMHVLRIDPNEPPNRKARLMDLGIDSLMAVELRGHLTNSLKLEHKLPATLIFDYPNIEAITDYLLQEVLTFEQSATETDAPITTSSAKADIEALSDDEVEAMLIKKLKKLK